MIYNILETLEFQKEFQLFCPIPAIKHKLSDYKTLLDVISKNRKRLSKTNGSYNYYEINLSPLYVSQLITTCELAEYFIDQSRINYSGVECCFPPIAKNQFFVTPQSIYGHYRVNCSINGNLISILINPKNKSYREDIHLVDPSTIQDLDDIVFMDIETTGLIPFLDDIIEIAFYDNKRSLKYSRYLPISKKNEISENITTLTGITQDIIKDAEPLSKKEWEQIVDDFDLYNKTIAFWSGQNLFDAVFLLNYLKEHDISDGSNLRFLNACDFFKTRSTNYLIKYSKDYIANYYDIDIPLQHRALTDCITEFKILKLVCENKLQQNTIERFVHKLVKLIQEDHKHLVDNANEFYNEFLHLCLKKYGCVDDDYDKNPTKRGKEFIDIHHLDELEIDNIGSKTQEALALNDKETLLTLSKYNKKERLVYCNKFEHFVLHFLIEVNKLNNHLNWGKGPHWLFGCILQIKFSNKAMYERMIEPFWLDILRMIAYIKAFQGYPPNVLDCWKVSKDHFDFIKHEINAIAKNNFR